jgi:hypothetical protein
MSPSQVAALGPELLPWAHAYTNDPNEAHLLVHCVVVSLIQGPGDKHEAVPVDDVKALMAKAAQRNSVGVLTLLPMTGPLSPALRRN